MEAPVFSTPLATIRAAPGASAVLHLPLPAGTSPFHFEWSRAGASLDDRFTSSDDAGGVRLSVTAARTGDSGVYTLQATNAAGKDTARVRLEVSADEAPTGDDPPTFLRRLQDLAVKVGTRTRFLVEIVSSTECKVTWYRNERRLMEAERVSLVRDGTFWCADIAAVSVDDTGRWTCTAENAGGRASCSAHLNVLVPKAYKRPEFVEELRALLTEQGTVSLECKVVGVPTPVLRWFKDSREIKAGDVFALTANAEDPTSLGTYTCEAVNCMGRAYSSSKVHVVGRGSREGSARPISSGVTPESPPIFTKELEDKFVRITEPLTLGCHIVVPPWPRSVVWYNKEGKVEAGERYHVVEDGVGGYMLEVPSAEWPDEGEWKCVATSSGGRIGFSSCYVSMEVPKNYRKPRFMENLQAVLTEEGLVSFECKVVGFPTPVLSWFKDGQELKPGDVYQLTGTNSLGSYCCIARNCMGQASSSAELTVEDIQNQLNEEEKLQLFSKNQAPKFIQGLKSVEAKIDEPFRFTIKVAIPPEPTVQWYRDDQPVDDSPRCHLAKEERGVFYLDIQSLEFLDQAEWKCVAVNDFGHSVTSCFLKLIIPRHYKKPRFLENLQAILSDEGAVNLECKVIGVPQPVLKWYKDGEELKPGDIHRIISGQDGTCCLGTYTCEAQNCMGIAASSASLLGFDDSMKAKANKKKVEEQPLQRNVSLSTIHEERSSQMYDTPVGDITLDDKAEISFSFDGKEVSVSLYDTPDLTEEDAIQIMEMYADQISENVTEHNVAELPPLRFVKETSTSGNLLMEAIIIDVSPDYFASPEEDLRTEADVEDISIADENGPPQLSLDQDLGGEDYLERTMELLSQEKTDIIPKKMLRKKSDSQRSADDFYSLSMDQTLSEDKKDDDITESFASARSLEKPKSKSSKPSVAEGQESSDLTKTILVKDEIVKPIETETPSAKTKRERRSSRGSRRSSSGSEKSFGRKDSKEEPNKPQVVTLEPAPISKKQSISDEEFKTKMTNVSSSLSKVMNDVQIIERDIILKSELMSSAATASRSLEIISSLIKPLSEIHSIADATRESALESREVSSTLFSNISQPLKVLQQSLTIIEKCIDVESDNKTLVKKTCVAFIESCGEEVKSVMNEIASVTDKEYLIIDAKILSDINSLVADMNNVIKFSADTIKTRNLLSEANEIKADEVSVEAKHLRDTQKAVFELKSPLNSLLRIVDIADEDKIVEVPNVKSSEVILNDMSASVQDLQAALEQIESLSVKESETSLHKYNTEIIETVMDSVLKLRGSFEQLPTETKTEEDKKSLKHALDSIKNNLSEISSHIVSIERNVGSFDILQSENKLETLQKMAQILITLENSLPRLENMVEVKTHMDVFHKNLTRVLENVIESNEAPKYFTLMEICEAVNRLNTSIANIDSDNVLSLASLSNTLRIIQDTVIKNVFNSELNCAILTNITDVLLSIQEALNHADEISLKLESERVQDITTSLFEINKANEVIEHINHTIAEINIIKSMESLVELKTSITPVLENICPILEDLKRNIASMKPIDVKEDEHISDMSDVSTIPKTLATPIFELNQNLSTLNQVIVENVESLKEHSAVMSAIAEPLHELHTTLQILQQDILSQYGEDITPCDVSLNIVNAVQNLQSCIVMIQEQPGVEGIDEMSTLEDISGIKTTAETLPSDRLVLPSAEQTAVEISLEPLNKEIVPSATAHALQSLNEHITILQSPEVVDALDTLSEVSDYSSLKSVALGLGELHAGIEEILHPFVMEQSTDIANLINTSKLAAIAEPMQELQQSLSVLDTSNIPIFENILEIPKDKIYSIIESISDFKQYLGKCIQALFPAMETAEKTIEISNKVEELREVCENLKVILETTKEISTQTPTKQQVITLEETVDSLLDVTDVSKGIQIQQVKTFTEMLFEKVITVQEDLIQYTPHTVEQLAKEAKLIQAIDEIKNNIAVLEQYDFVDLSRASEIPSCTTPTLAIELESEPLVEMDDILQNAVNVIQSSDKKESLADLMILEDFFKTCKNEFTIIRLLISKPLTHKKTIRLIQEYTFLQTVIKDFKSKRPMLLLPNDIDGYLKNFFVEAEKNLKIVQDSLYKVVNAQSEILITTPLARLEDIQQKLTFALSEKKEVENFIDLITKFTSIVEVAMPMLQTTKTDVIAELDYPAEPLSIPDISPIEEKIDDVLKFAEEQILTTPDKKETKEVIHKIALCLQKHQDYKDATGAGKNLIVLKCLSECAEILQATVIDKRAIVKEKIEDNTLKSVLSDMLEPLQALHSQLSNIHEQVTSGVEENSLSVDITSTESIVEAVSEIHKEIVQQIESGTASINKEDISLVIEADKEIHAIQDTIKSLENVPVVQEIKQITKPIEEIEKSLQNVIKIEKIETVTSELPKEKATQLLQHVDQYIELVDKVEEISTVIIKEELQESVKIARELRDNIAILESEENSSGFQLNIENIQADLAFQLQNLLSVLKVQVLDSSKYFESKLNPELLESFVEITSNLHNDLAMITIVQPSFIAPDVNTKDETSTEIVDSESNMNVTQGIRITTEEEIDGKQELTATIHDKSSVYSTDKEEVKSVRSDEVISENAANSVTVSKKEEIETSAADDIKKEEIGVKLKQHVEDFIAEDITGSVNKLSAVIDIEELKQTVNLAKELRENIASIENYTDTDANCVELEKEKTKQRELVQQLDNALITVQTQIFDNYQKLDSIFDTSKLQKVVEATVNLENNLSAVIVPSITTETEIESIAKDSGVKDSVDSNKNVIEMRSVENLTVLHSSEKAEVGRVESSTDKSNSETPEAMAEELKVAVLAESIQTVALKESIEQFISDEFAETLNNICETLNTEDLKQTVSLASELCKKIESVDSCDELITSLETQAAKEEQIEIAHEFKSALMIVQDQIFDNYHKLETVCDVEKLRNVADLTVNLQAGLSVITVSTEVKEKPLDSDSTIVPSLSVEPNVASEINQEVATTSLEKSLKDATDLDEKSSVLIDINKNVVEDTLLDQPFKEEAADNVLTKETVKNLNLSQETATLAESEVPTKDNNELTKEDDARQITNAQPVVESKSDVTKPSGLDLSLSAESELVKTVMDVKTVEPELKHVIETLIQNIETYITYDITQIVTELSSPVELYEFEQSLVVAGELKQNIASLILEPDAVHYTHQMVEQFLDQKDLAQKLKKSLIILKTFLQSNKTDFSSIVQKDITKANEVIATLDKNLEILITNQPVVLQNVLGSEQKVKQNFFEKETIHTETFVDVQKNNILEKLSTTLELKSNNFESDNNDLTIRFDANTNEPLVEIVIGEAALKNDTDLCNDEEINTELNSSTPHARNDYEQNVKNISGIAKNTTSEEQNEFLQAKCINESQSFAVVSTDHDLGHVDISESIKNISEEEPAPLNKVQEENVAIVNDLVSSDNVILTIENIAEASLEKAIENVQPSNQEAMIVEPIETYQSSGDTTKSSKIAAEAEPEKELCSKQEVLFLNDHIVTGQSSLDNVGVKEIDNSTQQDSQVINESIANVQISGNLSVSHGAPSVFDKNSETTEIMQHEIVDQTKVSLEDLMPETPQEVVEIIPLDTHLGLDDYSCNLIHKPTASSQEGNMIAESSVQSEIVSELVNSLSSVAKEEVMQGEKNEKGSNLTLGIKDSSQIETILHKESEIVNKASEGKSMFKNKEYVQQAADECSLEATEINQTLLFECTAPVEHSVIQNHVETEVLTMHDMQSTIKAVVLCDKSSVVDMSEVNTQTNKHKQNKINLEIECELKKNEQLSDQITDSQETVKPIEHAETLFTAENTNQEADFVKVNVFEDTALELSAPEKAEANQLIQIVEQTTVNDQTNSREITAETSDSVPVLKDLTSPDCKNIESEIIEENINKSQNQQPEQIKTQNSNNDMLPSVDIEGKTITKTDFDDSMSLTELVLRNIQEYVSEDIADIIKDIANIVGSDELANSPAIAKQLYITFISTKKQNVEARKVLTAKMLNALGIITWAIAEGEQGFISLYGKDRMQKISKTVTDLINSLSIPITITKPEEGKPATKKDRESIEICAEKFKDLSNVDLANEQQIKEKLLKETTDSVDENKILLVDKDSDTISTNRIQDSFETLELLKHIEAFISDEMVETIKEMAVATNITEIKDTVKVAKDLLENICIQNQPITLEKEKLLIEQSQIQQAELKDKLNKALIKLQEKVLDATQEVTSLVPVEKLDRVSDIVIQLQEDLKTAISSKTETHSGEDTTVSSKEESMKQLENLLQEVSDKIDLSSSEKVLEDNETLRDSLDEVQTVIIKLKRDFDGANDTLNETLEDLECSVRSVQLQINEDSPPNLLKEACATLQLLVNNMNEINETCVTESTHEIVLKDVFDKCSNEAGQTVQLLEKAANVDYSAQNKLRDIISNLNNLKDKMIVLRSGFTRTADTLIEKGTDIIQNLDQIEEKVFSIEKEIDSAGTLSPAIKDNIITAVHAVYGSISNMRSTVSSTQKQYMFENYGQPSENFLKSIKNLSTMCSQADAEIQKMKYKKLSKSLRNVMNHFEDIKFYINLDKTARLPSDAAFTKIILDDLKNNLTNISELEEITADNKLKFENCLKCVETYQQNIEVRSTLEVKEKIPIFKAISSLILDVTTSLKENLNKKLTTEKITSSQFELLGNQVVEKLREDIPQKAELAAISVPADKMEDERTLNAEEKCAIDNYHDDALPSTSKQALEDISKKEKTDTEPMTQLNEQIQTTFIEINQKGEPEKVVEPLPGTSKQVEKVAITEKTAKESKEKAKLMTEEEFKEITITDTSTKVQQEEEEKQLKEHQKQEQIDMLQSTAEEIQYGEITKPDIKQQEKIVKLEKSCDEQTEELSIDINKGNELKVESQLSHGAEKLHKKDNQLKQDDKTEAKTVKEVEQSEEKPKNEVVDMKSIHVLQEKAKINDETIADDKTRLQKDAGISLIKVDESKKDTNHQAILKEGDKAKKEDIFIKSNDRPEYLEEEDTKSTAEQSIQIDNTIVQDKIDTSATKADENHQGTDDVPKKEKSKVEESKEKTKDAGKVQKKQETQDTETLETERVQSSDVTEIKQLDKQGMKKEVSEEEFVTDKEPLKKEIQDKEQSERERQEIEQQGKEKSKKDKLKQEKDKERLQKEEQEKASSEKEKKEKKKAEKKRLDNEEQEKEILKKDMLEKDKERLEQENLEKEKSEKEWLVKKEQEKEREEEKLQIEKEEKGRLGKEEQETARLEKEKQVKELAEKGQSEKEEQEKKKLEKENLGMDKLEKENLEKEKEKERLRKKEEEKASLEKERSEEEKLEQEKEELEQEKEKLEEEKIKKEKMLQKEEEKKARLEKLEKEMLEKEKQEKERQEKEKEEKEKHQKEEQERERLEKEKQEKLRLEKEILEKEKLEKEKHEREMLELKRLEQEKQENDKKQKEEQERVRLENQEKVRLEKEKVEKDKLEMEKQEREKLELERLEQEKQEKEKKQKEEQERERLEKEKLEKEMLEKEKQEKERLEKERKEKEKQQKEEQDRERLEKEKQEKVRLEKEKLEKEKQEKEKLEMDRLEKEKQEKEKKQKVEQEKEKQEKVRLEKDKLEKEKLVKEKQEKEKLDMERPKEEKQEKEKKQKKEQKKEKQEKDKLEKGKLEKEKQQKEELEMERLEKEKQEKEKKQKEEQEKEKQEKVRLGKEKLEKEQLEKEKQEKEKQEKVRLENEKREKDKQDQGRFEKQEKEKLEKERIEKEKQKKERLKKEKSEKDRLEKETQEKDRLEKEMLEKENSEKERLMKEKQEKEQLDKEKQEAERLEKEKEKKKKDSLEKERQQKENLEKENMKKEKQETERLEKEKLEKENIEKERKEKEKQEKERLEKEKLEKENIEKERKEKEKQEKERLEKEKLEKQNIEKERKEKEKQEKERLEKENIEKERKEKEKQEKERLEKEKLEEKENIEKERKEKEKQEKERLEKEKLEKENIEKERKEKEKQEKERLEKEKLEKENIEKEKLEKENIEKERKKKEKQEKERLEKEKLEKENIEKERKEKEEQEKVRLEKEKLEKQNIEKERKEKEKQEKERLEKEKLEKENMEKERLEKEKQEKDRLDKEKQQKEKLEKENMEKERQEKAWLEKEKIEKERKEKQKKEKREMEKLEKEKQENERLEQDRLEKERLKKENEEKEMLEKGKIEKERLEKEQLEKEKRKKEKQGKDKEEKDRLAKEKQEKENSEKKRLEKGKQEKERLETEKQEMARQEEKKTGKEKLQKTKIATEKLETEKLATQTNDVENKLLSDKKRLRKTKPEEEGRELEKKSCDDSKKKPISDNHQMDNGNIVKEDYDLNNLDLKNKQEVTEISKIKLLDENEIKVKDLTNIETSYSRKLKSETKLGYDREAKTSTDESRYIKEYQYEPSMRPKHDDKEKPRFVDHNHRDYTMEFARPSAYREKTLEVENVSVEKNTSRGHIYKANTLLMDAQLRSSAPPRAIAPDTSRSSEPTERRSDVKHRSKAMSEARSVISEKRTASRDIKRKPVFSTHLTDRTAVEGSRVKLMCSVLSSTDPKVTWYKNGVVLDNKLKYRTKFIDGLITLEVLNAVPTDSAEYSCTVENENGSVNTSANLKVYPSFEASPIPPTFTRSIRDTFHLAENELVLECRIRGQPLPTITWIKDDRPVSNNERYQAYYLADGVCRLAISHPTPEDSGKYTCKAENSVWSDQITHVVNFTGHESRLSPNLATIERSRFNRQALESSRRPHFGNVLTDYKVAHGGTIGLQVEIRGAPTRVEWLREGRSVMETYSNARTYVEQGLYTLALSDVTERESGLYTCRAWSSHGTVDMNAAITVVQPNEMEGKPAIIAGRPEKDVLISVGEDLNISFRAQGEPKPKVIFMKGIRDITNSQRVCKMTSDDYVKFTVKRSVISDAGTYCVLVRNAYGCDRAFVTVVVRQRASSENLISDWTYPMDDSVLSITERKYKAVPDRIPGEPTVVDGGNNWVSIAWPKPDPQEATPVLAYKVESWLAGKEGGARWTELGITPLNSFDAFNLKQGEEYHFRVTPRNRYGWGEAVQTSSPIGVGLAGDRPEFIDILPGQLKVLIGETANLSCSVKGKPVPEVVWMKNGHEIDEDARVKTSFNGYNCSLVIQGISSDDEARYSCEATNEHGRASTYARLAVVTDRLVWEADVKLKRERSADTAGDYPPQFTMRLRDRRVQATYPVRLTCQVVGSPAPSVTWYKDGEEVIFDSRHSKSQDEHFHTLEIAPTTLEDGGVYEAMARNSSGAISCHCSLVVDKGIRAYIAPEFCCGLEPLYRLTEGEELRISAVVEAYPTVGVTWYRDGVRLRPSRRAIMTLDRDGQIELALAFVTPRDAGVYSCTASNEVGRASTSGKVEVIEGDASRMKKKTPPMVVSPEMPYSKEPMFIRKPRSSEAREGDTVIIQCEVVGDPKPDVYWLRDFLKPDYYRDATHFKRIGDGPEYRFEIPHAKLDYTGAYSVVAKNVHGEAKAIISLQILARDPGSTEEHYIRYGRVDVIPRFERNLTDLLCHDGDAIEFECHVSGHPEPDIRWFHYTELIRENPDFEWSLQNGTARLKIKQVTAEDEGTYLCEASNNLGKATSSACLVVYPPGEPNTLSQRLRRPPALLSAASTPRSTPRSTPARSVSRTPGPDPRRLCSPSRQMAPKFYTYPFNKVVEEGDHVVFQCAVKGLPAPWATWDKDGAIITPSSRITIREKDEILRILEIEQVTIEDVGTYRVTLENDYGRVDASARLEVITQKGKFYAGVRAYSASPRKSLPYRRRLSSSRQD